ncbi:hypothetical protein [Dyella caseinilytica]|uniref:Phosphatidylinositol diacylglycerol-lyase n=1 Tax=Dyella caseinilytica TaxID=1849581 RepID=A0ABX7GYR6_9GAMM|nr:hypothetical protein [Dyella caseinilytica]QRN55168.1 hypothetical protein ISN74_07515 [Dyella caseinilytica]GFZ99847.1 hypothetical protein GCM10011408_20780 [Dyella caseinilytica]
MPWMTQLFNSEQANGDDVRGPFPKRPLHRIALPGTHDSGCYVDKPISNSLSKTQKQDVNSQLKGGVRYFDIRPKYLGDQQFTTYHGSLYYGGMLTGDQGILRQIRDFFEELDEEERELVILNISHFSDFSDQAHQQLITKIAEEFKGFLVPFTQSEINLFDTPYQALLTDSDENIASRLVVLYDGALDTPQESYITKRLLTKDAFPPGFFVVAPKYICPVNNIFLFDQYANKIYVEDWGTFKGMLPDQYDKLTHRSNYNYAPNSNWIVPSGYDPHWTDNAPLGVDSTMHLLSWTLTPQSIGGDPITYADDYANPALASFFSKGSRWANEQSYDSTKDPQINIVYVDDYRSEVHNNDNSPSYDLAMPVAIAIQLNLGMVGDPSAW